MSSLERDWSGARSLGLAVAVAKLATLGLQEGLKVPKDRTWAALSPVEDPARDLGTQVAWVFSHDRYQAAVLFANDTIFAS